MFVDRFAWQCIQSGSNGPPKKATAADEDVVLFWIALYPSLPSSFG